MTGYQTAKAVADKLKPAEVDETMPIETAKEELTQLAVIKNDEALAKLYNDNASIGADNLAGELPVLKVHSVGKSMKNTLADGSEPSDGYFFYKPTGEQYKELEVHVLTISRGFKAEGMADPQGNTKLIFNQILGGVIIDAGQTKPFLMYFTGSKLSSLWEFGKEAGKYTKAKPFGIPMFALTVRLSTEKKENNFGRSWVVNFEIVKAEDGQAKLVLDPEEFKFLKESAISLQDTINNLIDTKTNKGTDEEVIPLESDMPFK
jgi:hypothetical protein